MKLAVPKEVAAGETRVALVPESVRGLVRRGVQVAVEAGAGAGALIADDAYRAAGATIESDAASLLGPADLVIKVAGPTKRPAGHEADWIRPGAALVCLLQPSANLELIRRLAGRGVDCLALEYVPRTTRAQAMDVLSSMGTIAGYRAVILAAGALRKLMPMMMTAAGTFQPASAVVIGAGVAGLQAVAILRKLGAVVKAIDTRPSVRQEVESLGARFIPLEVQHEQAQTLQGYARDLGEDFYRREQEIASAHIKGADIVIATAVIPNRRAPVLVTEAMVRSMVAGGVIVDLAAPAGGNCSMTRPGETVDVGGVTVMGPLNLPAQVPVHASQMFSRNVETLVGELAPDGTLKLDSDSDIIRAMLITRGGKIVHEPTLLAIAREAQQ